MIFRILIWLSLIPAVASGQDFLNRNVALKVTDMPVKDVLDQISEYCGVYFTYAGNLPSLEKKVTLQIEHVPLKKILHDLFYGEPVVYTVYSNQVILRKKPDVVKPASIKGVVLSSGTGQPVEFASIQYRISRKGTVAGFDGKFEINTSHDEVSDSLSFYCIGFEPRTISVKSLVSMDFHKVYLTPKLVELDPVEFSARKAQVFKEGNKGLPMGSLYLDTHGQKAALYLHNKKNRQGRIRSVSFYLSGKGNTEAPFRIRIYGVNDSLKCPGEEILPDIVVVKPDLHRGWCEVDISRYNIRFPESGIFIAMEGIYPGDYVRFLKPKGSDTQEDEESNTGDFIENSLEYGQRLGFNRFSKNDTWHYSLSHTWFQLDKKMFNVMITAEIVYYNQHERKKTKILQE